VDIVRTTGSFVSLELNFGGDVSNSTYFITTGIGTPYMSTSEAEYVYGPDFKTGSINIPLSSKINVEFSPEGYIFVFVLLKGWLGGTPKARYESLAREKVKNYIGLTTDVIILNDAVKDSN
jgi:hypothetical protein